LTNSRIAWALVLAASCLCHPVTAEEVELWDGLLARHSRSGGLDYESLAEERLLLDRYLTSVAETPVEGWEDDEKVAFWINAYNAGVAALVLDRYPGIESVRDVDGFFDELILTVSGTRLTLDEIESLARDAGDPRVHFAVVCASTSCPDLRGEAYVAERLEEQLEEQTAGFLSDTTKGMRFDAEEGDLYLSSIFKWYAGDFTGGSTFVAFFARSQVTEWILPHLAGELAERIRQADPSVAYMDYDWTLNDR